MYGKLEGKLIHDLKRVLKAGKHMQPLPCNIVQDLPQVAAYLNLHLEQLPVNSKIVRDSLILAFLYEHIRKALAHQRRHYLLPEPDDDSLREIALSELCQDFQQQDDDLESWSVLFHYHVRHDLNLSWNGLARHLDQEERTLRRRARSSVYLLAKTLILDAVHGSDIPDE